MTIEAELRPARSEATPGPAISLAMLPTPRRAYYEWEGSEGTRRESYLVIGVGVGQPKPPGQAYDVFHATFLLCIRDLDLRPTWMSFGQLTFEPVASLTAPETE